MVRVRFGRTLCLNPTTHPMPKRKQVKPTAMTQDDDPLFRALRQVADEALEEKIPERLLRVIRAARDRPPGGSEPGSFPKPSASKSDRKD